MRIRGLCCGMLGLGVAVLLIASAAGANAQQTADASVSIGGSDLGGVVTGTNGPEAGVWVIAETTNLPTKFAKIVVTDERGRYLMPDLPKANYSVWVRGYGLVDSAKVSTEPGKLLNLNAVAAPNAAAAAEYYPAIYWYVDAQGAGEERISGCRKVDRARNGGSTSSRPTAATAATRSATRRCARFRRNWASSNRPSRPGSGASSPARP